MEALTLHQPAIVVLRRFRRFGDRLLAFRSYTRSFMTVWWRYCALQQFSDISVSSHELSLCDSFCSIVLRNFGYSSYCLTTFRSNFMTHRVPSISSNNYTTLTLHFDALCMALTHIHSSTTLPSTYRRFYRMLIYQFKHCFAPVLHYKFLR